MFLNACFILCVLVLAACSDNGQGRMFEEPPVTFQPNEKPARPVSPALLQQVFSNLKNASTYIPEDAAYFSSIIVGDKAREVFYGSYDQQVALRKLTPEGRLFVKRLVTNCTLNPAKKNETGKNQPGGTVKMNLSLSSEGADCGYLLKKSVQRTRAFSQVSGDPKTGISRWSESVSSTMEDLRDLRDEKIRDLSRVMRLRFINKINGRVDYMASNEGFEISALLKGAGEAELAFADGMVLRGPVNSEAVTQNNKTTVKVRFLGSTGQGDILILVIRDDVNVLKVYVNGESAPNDILDAFGLNLMEVASHRY